MKIIFEKGKDVSVANASTLTLMFMEENFPVTNKKNEIEVEVTVDDLSHVSEIVEEFDIRMEEA